jgi:hypothetical protein
VLIKRQVFPDVTSAKGRGDTPSCHICALYTCSLPPPDDRYAAVKYT